MQPCWILDTLCIFFLCQLGGGTDEDQPLKCDEKNIAITDGNYTLSNGVEVGSILRFECARGYFPYPTASRRCEAYGEWTPMISPRRRPMSKAYCKGQSGKGKKGDAVSLRLTHTSECTDGFSRLREVRCPPPLAFENGVYHPRAASYAIGDSIRFECYDGYFLHGSESRTCQENGKWNGSMAICDDGSTHCPNPGIPVGSIKTGLRYEVDQRVRYQCRSGLVLFGSEERLCLESGEWTGSEPSCQDKYTYDTPGEVASYFGASLSAVMEVSKPSGKLGRTIKITKDGKLCVYILLDASDSVGELEFKKAKDAAMSLIERLSNYDVNIKYEVISYATEPKEIVSMANEDVSEDVAEVLESLKNFQYSEHKGKTGTNINAALKKVYEMMVLQSLIERNFMEIRHVIVLLTDGKSNMGNSPGSTIAKIRDFLNIKNPPSNQREDYLDIYVFGVGKDVDLAELNSLASKKPKEKHVFIVKNLDDLQKSFDEIVDDSKTGTMCGIAKDYSEADIQEKHPWHVNVIVPRVPKSDNCMGSIVSSRWILTAAHCFNSSDTKELERVSVVLGDKPSIKVTKLLLHPWFNIQGKAHKNIKEFYDYDVALIELEEAIPFSPKIRPICIPCTEGSTRALRRPHPGTTCQHHEAELLGPADIPAMFVSKEPKEPPLKREHVLIKNGPNKNLCNEQAKRAPGYENVTDISEVVTDRFLCTGGTYPHVEPITCKGESGGALFTQKKKRFFQVGVISWGIFDSCARRRNPPDYARDYHLNLFKVLPWLQENLKGSLSFLPLW
ncbi:complement factor B-like [Latimeria chalumnae]|uniref:complement factor B-like n=1 Tax=Latimeria chalumnae TaxID=7897 RepID=UPI00313AEA7A